MKILAFFAFMTLTASALACDQQKALEESKRFLKDNSIESDSRFVTLRNISDDSFTYSAVTLSKETRNESPAFVQYYEIKVNKKNCKAIASSVDLLPVE